MSLWEDYHFCLENEHLLLDLCSNLKSQNVLTDVATTWWELCQKENPFSEDTVMKNAAGDDFEINDQEQTIINAIKEALETNLCFEETLFAGTPFNSLYKIFQALTIGLDEAKFSFFCKTISSWKNDFLIEQALKAIVLPKLKEKNESSACTIFSVSELAKNKPSQLCYNVLSDLLSEENSTFSDVELLSKIYEVLPMPQKDFIILVITEKNDINEVDWVLLQPLVTCISPSATENLLNLVKKWASKFTKSLEFGKFIVKFCRCLTLLDNKDKFVKAIEQHETLFKKMALKILQK